ncbi:MAG: sel1 repeat family protein, partial [Myxococcales bacterium]|nr:sel1 repeat family protein [Myxococcales bacterium]
MLVARRLHGAAAIVALLALAALGCDPPRRETPDAGPPPVCPEAVPQRCFDRGVSLLDVDKSRAALAFAMACDGGVPEGCTNLGALYDEGGGVEVNLPRARELFDLGCKGGSPHGCFRLGRMKALGRGGAAELTAAFELFQKACGAKHGPGCHEVGKAYASGIGVKADQAKAVAAWETACSAGYDQACAALGLNLILGLKGVKRDAERGERLLLAACHQNDARACKDLGGLHVAGVLPKSDKSKGI